MKVIKIIQTCFVIAVPIMTSIIVLGCNSKDKEMQQNKAALFVNIEDIKPQDLNIDFEYPARLKSVRSVNVYARVEGILTSQNFKEGDMVQQGQTLFTIESTKYEAQATQAQAQYNTADANLTKATKDWKRVERLYKQGAYTVDQYDTSLYNYNAAKANLMSAKASLDDALLNLSYTKVVAEITGKTSLRQYDVGTLVGRNGGNDILTTITQLSPIYAEFSIPSNDFDYIRSLNRGDIIIKVLLNNGKTYNQTGKINFIDSVLDSQTLSVKARAIIDNNDFTLLPNEFVRLKIAGFKVNNAIVIPQNAIFQDSEGSYVYIVNGDEAKIAKVKIDRMLKNSQALVSQGLKAGDKVIISNLAKLHDGAKVQIAKIENNTDSKSESNKTSESKNDKIHDKENLKEASIRGLIQQIKFGKYTCLDSNGDAKSVTTYNNIWSKNSATSPTEIKAYLKYSRNFIQQNLIKSASIFMPFSDKKTMSYSYGFDFTQTQNNMLNAYPANNYATSFTMLYKNFNPKQFSFNTINNRALQSSILFAYNNQSLA